MCGLAGIIDPRGSDACALVAMADALAHRGPDGEGYAVLGDEPRARLVPREGVAGVVHAGLAHRRLTIIDPTDDSAQPMLDPSGRNALVYNGELYNYIELRAELERAGRTFRTAGDTEVVLQSWAHWGPSCVERFVGMWSFAILDAEARRLWLCRDRFGIKPLFYTREGGALRFASEIKGLLAAMPTPEPDEEVVAGFLLSAADTGDQTFFRGIRRLPAAHLLEVDLDDPAAAAPRRYWQLPSADGAVGDASARFAELFRDSVRIHTRSDVPVGTCLSGGLDSSSIVCTASALKADGLLPATYRHQAFGYVPPDEAVSERPWMELVVRQTGVALEVVRPDPDRFEGSLETIARQQDEPFGSTSIAAQWFVFEAARAAGMKVMLDGQGADEVLGGYHGYLTTVAAGLLSDRRPFAYARLAIDHRRRLGTWPAAGVTAMLPGPVRTAAARVRPAERSAQPAVGGVLAEPLERRAPALAPPAKDMQALLHQQVQTGLPSLLRYEDRNSMAHSIEARVPFLDHRLVELAFRLPAIEKVRGADTKRLLREAMRGVLPEPIRTRRDKLGFRADPRAAARFAIARRDELAANATAAEERWFDPRAVRAFVDAAQVDPGLDFPLWRIVNVKLWARAHWPA